MRLCMLMLGPWNNGSWGIMHRFGQTNLGNVDAAQWGWLVSKKKGAHNFFTFRNVLSNVNIFPLVTILQSSWQYLPPARCCSSFLITMVLSLYCHCCGCILTVVGVVEAVMESELQQLTYAAYSVPLFLFVSNLSLDCSQCYVCWIWICELSGFVVVYLLLGCLGCLQFQLPLWHVVSLCHSQAAIVDFVALSHSRNHKGHLSNLEYFGLC